VGAELAMDSDHLRAAFARADLVVDCTSVGLQPRPSGRWSTRSRSTCSHRTRGRELDLPPAHPPARTRRQRGHAILDGRAMLVHQGARAFTIWTGIPAPIDAMTRALE